MKNHSLLQVWRSELRNHKFNMILLLTGLILIASAFYFSRFLSHIEMRQGTVLDDPLLKLYSPSDVTWITFSIIYISVILAFWHLLHHPRWLLLGLQAYILLLLVRTISMYFMALDPPPLMIPLRDPFVQTISSGVLTRDLFFSGHTSTLFLLSLVARSHFLRIGFLAATTLVAVCVLWQHVHYSIDIIAAPFYAYTCYRIGILFHRRLFSEEI